MKGLIALLLSMFWAFNAQAGALEKACGAVHKKLASGPYESLTQMTQDFAYDGKQYRGCVIHLSADARKVTDSQSPDGLFGDYLPFCPEGEVPVDIPAELRNTGGWCADRMADKPDGTTYRAIRDDLFCIVEGRWDSGDGSNPNDVPSFRYEVIVKCANR